MTADESVSGFFPPGNVTLVWTIFNEGSVQDNYAAPPSCRHERNPEIHLTNEAGTEVAWRPTGTMECMIATRLLPLYPGHNVTAQWTWDGMVYDAGGAHLAPAGPYTVRAAFSATRDDGSAVGVQVSLDVSLLEGNPGAG